MELRRKLQEFSKRCKLQAVSDFKSPQQREVVRRVLDGQDVLAIMPTGSGKSLTFQFPAYQDSEHITLVISPLKALMNQHAEFPGAVSLNSDKDVNQKREIWAQLKRKEKFILLVSPEMLAQQHESLAKLPIGRFVVDEVHCLSDWGQDFRPQYWWIAHFLRCLERGRRIPRLLLTATANGHVLDDIARHFPEVTDKATHVRAPLGRPELVLSALEVDGRTKRLKALVKFLKRQKTRTLPPGTLRRGIVFNLEAVSTEDDDNGLPANGKDRLKANQVVEYLKKNGIKKAYAYASKGMNDKERQKSLDAFAKATSRLGQVTVVVATNAFGMGMDFPGVPFVSHLYPRPTLSEYWQQVGRAGRNMKNCHAETLALYSDKDDEAYASKFARVPALDGLINAFTVPLHGWIYAFNKGGYGMSLLGEKGERRTQFAMLLEDLQKAGLVAEKSEAVSFPRGMVRFKVNLDFLKSKKGQSELERLRIKRRKQRKLRKVFRYFAIALHSKAGKYILLDQTEYKEDRAGTVLQRLNRWVDLGLLVRDDAHKVAGEVKLKRIGKNLTNHALKAVEKLDKEWTEFKRRGVKEAMSVLRAGSPDKRRALVQKHFQEKPDKVTQPGDLPEWLNH